MSTCEAVATALEVLGEPQETLDALDANLRLKVDSVLVQKGQVRVRSITRRRGRRPRPMSSLAVGPLKFTEWHSLYISTRQCDIFPCRMPYTAPSSRNSVGKQITLGEST